MDGSDKELFESGSDEESCDSSDEIDTENEDEDSEDEEGSEDEEIEDEREEYENIEHTGAEVVSDGDPDKEYCPICLNAFVGQDLGVPDSCEHAFCFECIWEWSKNINTCPIDRTKFNYIRLRSSPTGKDIKKVKVKVSPKEPEDAMQENVTLCEVCNSGDREDRLLLCDGCDLAYHCECLDPPLFYIPIEEWFCSSCSGVFQNGAVAGPSHAATRRVIPRTRASETVRSRVQNLRRGAPSVPRSSSNCSRRAPATPKKKRKRRTYRKCIKKVVQLARTKHSMSGAGKGKLGARGSTVVITYRGRRRKRRKVRTKRSSKKSPASSSSAASAQQRIAVRLGIKKSEEGSALPLVKKQAWGKGTRLGSGSGKLPSCSLFGNKDQLMDFNENFNEDVSSSPSTSRVTSTASNRRRISEETPSTSSVNLLDSILAGQKLLHTKSDNIVIKTDGSLVVKSKDAAMKKKDPIKNAASNSSSRTPMSVALAKDGVRTFSPNNTSTNNNCGKSSMLKLASVHKPYQACSQEVTSSNNKNLNQEENVVASGKLHKALGMDRKIFDDKDKKSSLSNFKIPKRKNMSVENTKDYNSFVNDLDEIPQDWEAELSSSVKKVQVHSSSKSESKLHNRHTSRSTTNSFSATAYGSSSSLSKLSTKTTCPYFDRRNVSDNETNSVPLSDNTDHLRVKQEILSDDETNIDSLIESVLNETEESDSTLPNLNIKNEPEDIDSDTNASNCMKFGNDDYQDTSESEHSDFDASESLISPVPNVSSYTSQPEKWKNKIPNLKIKEEELSDNEGCSESLVSNADSMGIISHDLFLEKSSQLRKKDSQKCSEYSKNISIVDLPCTQIADPSSGTSQSLSKDKQRSLKNLNRALYEEDLRFTHRVSKSKKSVPNKESDNDDSDFELPPTQKDLEINPSSSNKNKSQNWHHNDASFNDLSKSKIKEKSNKKFSSNKSSNISFISINGASSKGCSNNSSESPDSEEESKSDKSASLTKKATNNKSSNISFISIKPSSKKTTKQFNASFSGRSSLGSREESSDSGEGSKSNKSIASPKKATGNKSNNISFISIKPSSNITASKQSDASFSGRSSSNTEDLQKTNKKVPSKKTSSVSFISLNKNSKNHKAQSSESSDTESDLPETQVVSTNNTTTTQVQNITKNKSTDNISKSYSFSTELLKSSNRRKKLLDSDILVADTEDKSATQVLDHCSLNEFDEVPDTHLMEQLNIPSTQLSGKSSNKLFPLPVNAVGKTMTGTSALPSAKLSSLVPNTQIESYSLDLPATQLAPVSTELLNLPNTQLSNASVSLSESFDLPATQLASVPTNRPTSSIQLLSTPLSEYLDDLPATQLDSAQTKLSSLHTQLPNRPLKESSNFPATQIVSPSLNTSVQLLNTSLSESLDLPATQLDPAQIKSPLHFRLPNRHLSESSDLPATQIVSASLNTSTSSIQLLNTSLSESLHLPPTQLDPAQIKSRLHSPKPSRPLNRSSDLPATQLASVSLTAPTSSVQLLDTSLSESLDLPPTQLDPAQIKLSSLHYQLPNTPNITLRESFDLPATQIEPQLLVELPASPTQNMPLSESNLPATQLASNSVGNRKETCKESLSGNLSNSPDAQKGEDSIPNMKDILLNIKQLVSNLPKSSSDVIGNNQAVKESLLEDKIPNSSVIPDENISAKDLSNEQQNLNKENESDKNKKNENSDDSADSDDDISPAELREMLAKSSKTTSPRKDMGVHKHLPQVIGVKPVIQPIKPKPPNRKTFSFEEVEKLEEDNVQGRILSKSPRKEATQNNPNEISIIFTNLDYIPSTEIVESEILSRNENLQVQQTRKPVSDEMIFPVPIVSIKKEATVGNVLVDCVLPSTQISNLNENNLETQCIKIKREPLDSADKEEVVLPPTQIPSISGENNLLNLNIKKEPNYSDYESTLPVTQMLASSKESHQALNRKIKEEPLCFNDIENDTLIATQMCSEKGQGTLPSKQLCHLRHEDSLPATQLCSLTKGDDVLSIRKKANNSKKISGNGNLKVQDKEKGFESNASKKDTKESCQSRNSPLYFVSIDELDLPATQIDAPVFTSNEISASRNKTTSKANENIPQQKRINGLSNSLARNKPLDSNENLFDGKSNKSHFSEKHKNSRKSSQNVYDCDKDRETFKKPRLDSSKHVTQMSNKKGGNKSNCDLPKCSSELVVENSKSIVIKQEKDGDIKKNANNNGPDVNCITNNMLNIKTEPVDNTLPATQIANYETDSLPPTQICDDGFLLKNISSLSNKKSRENNLNKNGTDINCVTKNILNIKAEPFDDSLLPTQICDDGFLSLNTTPLSNRQFQENNLNKNGTVINCVTENMLNIKTEPLYDSLPETQIANYETDSPPHTQICDDGFLLKNTTPLSNQRFQGKKTKSLLPKENEDALDDEISIVGIKSGPKVKEVVLICDDGSDITISNEFNNSNVNELGDTIKKRHSTIKSSEQNEGHKSQNKVLSQKLPNHNVISRSSEKHKISTHSDYKAKNKKHIEEKSRTQNKCASNFSLDAEHNQNSTRGAKTVQSNRSSKHNNTHKNQKKFHKDLKTISADSALLLEKKMSKQSIVSKSNLKSKKVYSDIKYNKSVSYVSTTKNNVKHSNQQKSSSKHDSKSKSKLNVVPTSKENKSEKYSNESKLSGDRHKHSKTISVSKDNKHSKTISVSKDNKHSKEISANKDNKHSKEISASKDNKHKKHLENSVKHETKKLKGIEIEKSSKNQSVSIHSMHSAIDLDSLSLSSLSSEKSTRNSSEKENETSQNNKEVVNITLNASSKKRLNESKDFNGPHKKLRLSESSDSESHLDLTSRLAVFEKEFLKDKMPGFQPFSSCDSNDSFLRESPNLPTTSDIKKISRSEELKEEIANEVKFLLKPFYTTGLITKDAYKEIMRKAVPKIFMNCNNCINPDKIKKLVFSYVAIYTKNFPVNCT